LKIKLVSFRYSLLPSLPNYTRAMRLIYIPQTAYFRCREQTEWLYFREFYTDNVSPITAKKNILAGFFYIKLHVDFIITVVPNLLNFAVSNAHYT
jgi:hypothetical protein